MGSILNGTPPCPGLALGFGSPWPLPWPCPGLALGCPELPWVALVPWPVALGWLAQKKNTLPWRNGGARMGHLAMTRSRPGSGKQGNFLPRPTLVRHPIIPLLCQVALAYPGMVTPGAGTPGIGLVRMREACRYRPARQTQEWTKDALLSPQTLI